MKRSVAKRFFQATIVSLLWAGHIRGAMTIDYGEISVGADFASSEFAPRSYDVFYDSANLATEYSASFPSGAGGGWSQASWNLAGGSNPIIYATGSSIQGSNGNGYGWGFSDFDAQISLSQAYSYTVSGQVLNVSGVSGTGSTGFFPAATYTFGGSTYGNSGNYGVNLHLTPTPAAQSQVLAGVSGNATIAMVVAGDGVRDGISATISAPAGETLLQAAQALAPNGTHFNWQQTIISVPASWQFTVNNLMTYSSAEVNAYGLADPIGQATFPGNSLVIENTATGYSNSVIYASPNENTNGTDYFDDAYAEAAGLTSLQWSDTPNFPHGLLTSGESVGFKTQLVLEDANDNVLDVIGAPIYWWTDQTTSGQSISDSTLITQSGLGPADGGGIYLGEVDVPEPGICSLFWFAAVGLLWRRCERKVLPR